MSRKQHKDPLGFVFDTRSGAVRAQGGCSESIREKVQAVRAVVPNRSNTEIVLVLQHFDNAVDRTVQAFMEGNASEVLKEWTVTGKKKPKKKKSKPRPQPSPGPAPSDPEPWAGPTLNGFHGNGGDAMETLSDSGDTALGNEIPNFAQKSQIPNPNRSSPGSPGGKKSGCSLEKSLKDLQRCSVALARFRALLRDEVENSLRRAKAAFGEIQSCLMDREVALLAEMDKVKAEAMELLSLRQRRAEALRALTEAAPGMSEEQLLELRADIKHFVSERKFDEELGRAGRFGCDLEGLRGSIGAFGHVSHPRPSYSSRSRCSSGPAVPTGSAVGSSVGSSVGSAVGSSVGSALGSSVGSSVGSALGSSAGSALGSSVGSSAGPSPAFPGSTLGSHPGSPPGPPQDRAEPPPEPQPPQRRRKPPGSSGPRPPPQRPPGSPKPQKPPQSPPGVPKSPGSPKPHKPPRGPPGKPRRSRPEGANS